MVNKSVKDYYDLHSKKKVQDYLHTNARIEAAWKTIMVHASKKTNNILEIGCGVGSISYRLSNRFKKAKVVATDISPKSLEIARKYFSTPNTTFVEGVLHTGKIQGKFDLIILMDVYEHIAVVDRKELHAAIQELLADRGKIILSIPTPHYISWLKKNIPAEIQPIDEDINVEVLLQLAKDTKTELTFYKKVNIWKEGDYAHAVLERNCDFNRAFDETLKLSFTLQLSRVSKKLYWSLRKIKNSLRMP